MKKLKYVIIIVILIICVIVTALIVRYNNQKTHVETVQQDDPIDSSFKRQNNRMLYYSIEASINDYLTYIVGKNNLAVYNTLSDDYIKENNITVDNVLDKVEKIEIFDNFTVKEMYINRREQNSTNCVYGVITYNNVNYDWYGLFDTDYEYFTITPCSKSTYESIVNNKEDIIEKNIKQNDFNIINEQFIDDEDMARKYLKDYTEKALNSPEKAYNLLDEEYRDKRFASLEDYKKYVEDNKENLQNAVLKQYLFEYSDYDETCQITLCDTYDNYYIIHENAIMDYTIKLDTYTIETDEYVQEYQKATNAEKVATNITKFFLMLNNKDYSHAYNCLADSFKTNNFKNQTDFENYMKENFSYNIITIGEIRNEANVYTTEVTIKNGVSNAAETKKINVVMQLQEGTDFVMSFGE